MSVKRNKAIRRLGIAYTMGILNKDGGMFNYTGSCKDSFKSCIFHGIMISGHSSFYFGDTRAYSGIIDCNSIEVAMGCKCHNTKIERLSELLEEHFGEPLSIKEEKATVASRNIHAVIAKVPPFYLSNPVRAHFLMTLIRGWLQIRDVAGRKHDSLTTFIQYLRGRSGNDALQLNYSDNFGTLQRILDRSLVLDKYPGFRGWGMRNASGPYLPGIMNYRHEVARKSLTPNSPEYMEARYGRNLGPRLKHIPLKKEA